MRKLREVLRLRLTAGLNERKIALSRFEPDGVDQRGQDRGARDEVAGPGGGLSAFSDVNPRNQLESFHCLPGPRSVRRRMTGLQWIAVMSASDLPKPAIDRPRIYRHRF